MLADTCGVLVRALELDLDLAAVLGSVRSKRFSMLVEDGTVTKLNIEPDGKYLRLNGAGGGRFFLTRRKSPFHLPLLPKNQLIREAIRRKNLLQFGFFPNGLDPPPPQWANLGGEVSITSLKSITSANTPQSPQKLPSPTTHAPPPTIKPPPAHLRVQIG